MKLSEDDLKRCFDANRMSALIDQFAEIGRETGGGVTRLAFTPEDVVAREKFINIVKSELGLEVHVDSLGNIFARREGRNPNWPVIMTGSHLDSVRNGGKYDGPAGVFSSLEAFRALQTLDFETAHPFELCVLASEEPNTFGISTFGSRGLIGSLTKRDLASLRNDQGEDFEKALGRIGGDLNRIAEAVRPSGSIGYFLELHIEQMPYLESEHKDIGIVEGVTGIYRETIKVKGVASHCGTTPMAGRKDALCAAAQIILAIETAARDEGDNTVATVGHLTLFPNSINITPAEVTLDAEIRSYYPQSIRRMIGKMETAITRVEHERLVEVTRQITYDSAPTQFSHTVKEAIQQAAQALGYSTKKLVSMAGHDAAHLNRISESGMIFIPCRDGISHCPDEYTDIAAIIKGAQCLLNTLLILDGHQRGDN